MKAIGFVLLLVSSRLLGAETPAGITLVGVMTVDGSPKVNLLDQQSGQSSGWVPIGSTFAGYAIVSYDRSREALTLTKSNGVLIVPLLTDAKTNPSSAETVKVGRFELKLSADHRETKDGVRYFRGHANVAMTVVGEPGIYRARADNGILDLTKLTLLLTGSVTSENADGKVTTCDNLTLHLRTRDGAGQPAERR